MQKRKNKFYCVSFENENHLLLQKVNVGPPHRLLFPGKNFCKFWKIYEIEDLIMVVADFVTNISLLVALIAIAYGVGVLWEYYEMPDSQRTQEVQRVILERFLPVAFLVYGVSLPLLALSGYIHYLETSLYEN